MFNLEMPRLASAVKFIIVGMLFQVSLTGSSPAGPKFDTSHWLCSSSLDISQLRVQYFAVNLQQQSSGPETDLKTENEDTAVAAVDGAGRQFLLLDVALESGDWSYQRCLYQVDLSPSSSKPQQQRVVKNWACGWETIMKMCRVLLDEGNVDSVYNVTTELAEILNANGEHTMRMLRVMLNCDMGEDGPAEITHLSEVLLNASKHTTLEEIAGPGKVQPQEVASSSSEEPPTSSVAITTEVVKLIMAASLDGMASVSTLVRVKRNATAQVAITTVASHSSTSAMAGNSTGSTDVANGTTAFPTGNSITKSASSSSAHIHQKVNGSSTQNLVFRNISKPLGIIVLVIVVVAVLLIIYAYCCEGEPQKTVTYRIVRESNGADGTALMPDGPGDKKADAARP